MACGPLTTKAGREVSDEHVARLAFAFLQAVTLAGGLVSWIKPQLVSSGRCVAAGMMIGLGVGMVAGLTLDPAGPDLAFAAPFAFGGALAGAALGHIHLWPNAQRGDDWHWPF